MFAFLSSRPGFFSAIAVGSAGVLLLVLALSEEGVQLGGSMWLLCAIAAAAAALLCICYARKKSIRPLLPASKHWGLLLLSLVIIAVGDLYAFSQGGLYFLTPLFLTMGSFCLMWALLKRLSLLILGPFLVLELAQSAGYLQYGSHINSLVLAETFEASGEEAFGYLTPLNLGICVGALVGSALLCYLLTKLLRAQSRLTLASTSLVWLAVAAALSATLPRQLRTPATFWPIGEAYLLQQACSEALYHNHATIKQAESLPSPTEQPSSLHTLQGGEGVVLVLHIGESVRADRMSINGYARDTTPWLRTQPRLINFPHCISAACDTCQAQIAILTDARRDIYETDPALLPHTGSVLDLFAAHGFKVYSFFGKRNASKLKYDRVVRLLTQCSEARFSAPGSPWTALPQVADTLRRCGDKQNILLVINNEGSHTPFFHYDRTNPPFSPISSHFDNPAAHAEEVNNAYDATVHYTDEFVHRMTHLLHGRPWLYLYISDHGEYLGHDGIWGRAGLGESHLSYHSTTGCRVGMFLLSSPELEAVHPRFASALRALQAHADMTVAHEHIFHTLLGFFDLRTPHYNPELDLTSPAPAPYSGPAPAEETATPTQSPRPPQL